MGKPTGHITVSHTLPLDLNQAPPSSFDVPPAPSDDYTTSLSVDLLLGDNPMMPFTPDYHGQWLATLPKLQPIHKSIAICDLSVPLPIIGALASTSQRHGKHTSLLSSIVATATTWDLDDMKNFVKADLSKLGCLCLARKDVHFPSSYVEDKDQYLLRRLGRIHSPHTRQST
jgi:hypothetical protein